MSHFTFTDAHARQFEREGYVIVDMFSPDEIALLQQVVAQDEHGVIARAMESGSRDDGRGGKATVALFNDPGDDSTLGIFSRCRKLITAAERLLGGEPYLWHRKLNIKQPRTRGQWRAHQDFFYWGLVRYGCLKPHLLTSAIAVSEATEANGCIRLLKGSQELPRIDHEMAGDQPAIPDVYLEAARKLYEEVPVVMTPGQVVFFNCLAIHWSLDNESDDPRMLYQVAFNRRDNSPVTTETRHVHYSPINVVDDAQILGAGAVAMSAQTQTVPRFEANVKT